MKYFAVIALAVVAVTAESPSGPVFIARYSAPPQQQAPVVPYPISAAHPQAYVLAKQQVAPPQVLYGFPQGATTEAAVQNSTDVSDIETTTEPLSEQVNSGAAKKDQEVNKKEKLQEDAEVVVPVDQGVYYLYHPTGVLQRVAYSTSNDVRNMAYVAQLKYQNVDPISEPIYTYDPETFVLQQVTV